MCETNGGGDGDGGPHVRLVLCPHGTYHLTVGMATLRLSEVELAFVARAILAMGRSHPSLYLQFAIDGNAPDAVPPPSPAEGAG
jgi:hypothetical protein